MCERAARAFFFLGAGLLRLQDWRVLTRQFWQRFYHREEQILSGLMDWERTLYEGFIPPGSRILIAGSGSGRDLLGLLTMGHTVVGVEACGSAITRARRVLGMLDLSAEIHEGFIQDVSLPDRFDAIVFSYYCYAYIPGSADRVRALANAGRHLAPGGLILLSYPFSAEPSRAIALTRLAARLSRSDWRPDPTDVLRFPVDDTGRRFVQYEHIFTLEEIEREAKEAGLCVTSHTGLPDQTAVLVPVSRENGRAPEDSEPDTTEHTEEVGGLDGTRAPSGDAEH
jgi:SAM-dependent methyltransferase